MLFRSVRRAGVGESNALPLDATHVGEVVHALRGEALHSHATANDSFASFLREQAQHGQADKI